MVGDLYSDIHEAESFETGYKVVLRHWVEGVVVVCVPDHLLVAGVCREERGTRPQDAEDLDEDAVLRRRGRNMVQDVETRRRREAVGAEVGCSCIALNDADVGAGEPSRERSRERRVDLDCSDVGGACAQDVRRQARARTHFEHVVAEVGDTLDPGQQIGFETAGPLRARQVIEMLLVHRRTVVQSAAVAVPSPSAEDVTAAANVAFVDLRASADIRAGTYPWNGPDVVTGWHRHPYHQIEYAMSGVAEVETATGRYLLPPQQAIWIPAGLAHNTTLRRVRSVSVFFDPTMVPGDPERARVLAAAPVVREMISYGVRWSIARPVNDDPDADDFFVVLGRLVTDWLRDEVPLCLPTSADPLITAVMRHTDDNLATVTIGSICRAVGVSERTLRRRFAVDTGMTWQDYRLQSRLLRAMSMLSAGEATVLGVAAVVGFESPSGFARAFRKLTGSSPSAYRASVNSTR